MPSPIILFGFGLPWLHNSSNHTSFKDFDSSKAFGKGTFDFGIGDFIARIVATAATRTAGTTTAANSSTEDCCSFKACRPSCQAVLASCLGRLPFGS